MKNAKTKAILIAAVAGWTLAAFSCGLSTARKSADRDSVAAQVQAATQPLSAETAALRSEVARLASIAGSSPAGASSDPKMATEVAALRQEVTQLRSDLEKVQRSQRETAKQTIAQPAEGPPPTYAPEVKDRVPGQTLKGVRVDVVECRLQDRRLEVDFLAQNITDQDFTIQFDGRTNIQNSDGSEKRSAEYLMDGKINRNPNHRMVAGLPVKGTVYFDAVDPDLKVLPYFCLCVKREAFQPDRYTFRDVPIVVP